MIALKNIVYLLLRMNNITDNKMLTRDLIKKGLVGVLSLLFISSCMGGAKKTIDSSQITWDSIAIDKVLSINEDSIRYDIQLKFLYPKNDTSLYRLVLNRMFGDSIEGLSPKELLEQECYSFIDENDRALKIVELDSAQANTPREVAEDEYSPDYNFFEENSLMYADSIVVSIQYYNYAYMGGAHGMDNYFYLVYDRAKKDIITESDLFDEANMDSFQQVFTKLLIEKMKKEYDTYDSEEPMWQSMETVKPNGNFYLTEHSLIYQFNHYEIGAYAMGTPVLEIPYELIKALVKENSPIARILRARK